MLGKFIWALFVMEKELKKELELKRENHRKTEVKKNNHINALIKDLMGYEAGKVVNVADEKLVKCIAEGEVVDKLGKFIKASKNNKCDLNILGDKVFSSYVILSNYKYSRKFPGNDSDFCTKLSNWTRDVSAERIGDRINGNNASLAVTRQISAYYNG